MLSILHDLFLERGFHVVRFNSRGVGRSTGRSSFDGLKEEEINDEVHREADAVQRREEREGDEEEVQAMQSVPVPAAAEPSGQEQVEVEMKHESPSGEEPAEQNPSTKGEESKDVPVSATELTATEGAHVILGTEGADGPTEIESVPIPTSGESESATTGEEEPLPAPETQGGHVILGTEGADGPTKVESTPVPAPALTNTEEAHVVLPTDDGEVKVEPIPIPEAVEEAKGLDDSENKKDTEPVPETETTSVHGHAILGTEGANGPVEVVDVPAPEDSPETVPVPEKESDLGAVKDSQDSEHKTTRSSSPIPSPSPPEIPDEDP